VLVSYCINFFSCEDGCENTAEDPADPEPTGEGDI